MTRFSPFFLLSQELRIEIYFNLIWIQSSACYKKQNIFAKTNKPLSKWFGDWCFSNFHEEYITANYQPRKSNFYASGF